MVPCSPLRGMTHLVVVLALKYQKLPRYLNLLSVYIKYSAQLSRRVDLCNVSRRRQDDEMMRPLVNFGKPGSRLKSDLSGLAGSLTDRPLCVNS